MEENSEEQQYANLESYLAPHNTYEANQYIHQEYRSRLHALDDDQYYAEIDRAYYSHEAPIAQDYQPANQSAEPRQRKRSDQERRVARSYTFGPRTRSLQSCIQHKIKKNQRLRQRYANNC